MDGLFFSQKWSFLSRPTALSSIKGLGWTKTHDKTFAVMGGFRPRCGLPKGHFA